MPIRSHRLVVVCSLALLVLSVAPVATAQGGATLAVSPTAADATPGNAVLFGVTLRNDNLVTSSFDFAVTNFSPDWTYNFSQSSVTIAAGAESSVTLTVYAAENASAGEIHELFVRAYQTGTEIEAAQPVAITVDVVAPTEPESEPAPTAPPAQLTYAVDNAAAAPGETATGRLILHNADTRDLSVWIALSAGGWNARVDGTEFIVLHPDQTRAITLLADIPTTVANGTTRVFDIQLTERETAFSTMWAVTAEGEPATTTDGSTTDDGTGDATTSDAGGADGATTDDTQSAPETVALTLHKLLVEVAPGATGQATLTLANPTAGSTLVALSAEVPEGWSVAFESDTIPLDAGATRDITFSITAPADAIPGGIGKGAILATADGQPTQRAAFSVSPIDPPFQPTANDGTTDATTATGAVLATDGEKGTLTPIAIGLGAVGLGAAAVSRRSWRERLMWVGVGLYTRLLRPDILRHEEREKLHILVGEQPGIHFHALQRELGWNTGTLTYHVRVLERHNFLVSRRDGQLRRFYHTGAAPRKETFDGPSGLRADVLEAVTTQPGLSQSDLTLALGANKQTVNYHVKALERQGLIRIEKRGRDTFLYVVGEVPSTRSESASA